MPRVEARGSLVCLDTFEKSLHNWRPVAFGPDKKTTMRYKFTHNNGAAHMNGLGVFTNIVVVHGMQKQFSIPKDTKWKKLYFEFQSKSYGKVIAANNLSVSISSVPTKRANSRVLLGKKIFDGVDSHEYPNATPTDSRWQIFEVDLSKISTSEIIILISSLDGFGRTEMEFFIKNLYIIRTLHPDEKFHHLPDGHKLKVMP